MRGFMQFVNLLTGKTINSMPWQDELDPGSFYAIENPVIGMLNVDGFDPITIPDNVIVYGEILNADGCDEGFFNVRAYSTYCPDGEEGLFCVADATRRISREEFESAREKGWIE
jgi:hypothetical protein